MPYYDAAGNMTTDVAGSTYTYDAEDRVTSVTGGGSTTNYTYRPDGLRATKQTGSLTYYYSYDYDGSLIVRYKSGTGINGVVPYNQEVWLGGEHLATIPGVTNASSHAAVDQIGSERVEADGSSNIYASMDYLPFGDGQAVTGNTQSTIRFAGKELDTESGDYYFGARYYSPTMGRFMSPDFNAADDDLDPVPYADLNNPQSLNLYSYVQNNPLSHKDADGHKCDGGSVGPDGTFTFHCTNDPPPNSNGTAYQLAGALGAGFAPETGGASLGIAAGFVGAMLAAEYIAAHPIHLSSSNEPAPTTPGAAPTAPVPSGLVGTQDGKSGQAGGRHNSGPLDPAHGGSGDAARDFNTLTGGKAGPAPAGSNYPPGTQVGDNGISLRPARGNSGPRIDIPANGDKPHETLHYPN